jgi:putative DNA primase/helicase
MNDNLISIFGGAWSPPVDIQKHIEPPEIQFRQAIENAGFEAPDQIILDGKLRRFRSGTKGSGGHGDKTGWYVGYHGAISCGAFGCWRDGSTIYFKADVGRTFSPSEEMAITRRMAEAKAARDAETEKRHETAASIVDTIWSGCTAASQDHPYLARKGIAAHGSRVTGDGRLVVPLYSSNGELSSLQYISADGSKLYHSGGATGGMFWMLGVYESGPLYIAEGFATAATIYESTGHPCAIAYSASNLPLAAGAMRDLYADADLIVVADNDASGVGQRYADQASAKYNCRVIIPPQSGDANDYAQAGGDLLDLLEPKRSDWLVSADDFCSQPSPISWLVKGWLQDQALIMIHGPSGGGKTFAVLDMCLSIASSKKEWADAKVKAGSVIYLAGEGHHGLRGRVAAWKQHNNAGKLSMWLSKSGCDINTPVGYRQAHEAISELKTTPSVIIIDTLHRFLSGDENSSVDAKSMLDACALLMQSFNCSVILVHHTGVSDEAQHRARGSSAWRGALDIEISVVPAKMDKHGNVTAPMEIIQRKSKDAELAHTLYASLQSVPIAGWFDEDGEQVTSAVLVIEDSPETTPVDSIHTKDMRMIENAWFASGMELRQNAPYISRSALATYLEKNLNMKEGSIKNYLKPSFENSPINRLILSEILGHFEHGFILKNDVQISALLIRKNG